MHKARGSGGQAERQDVQCSETCSHNSLLLYSTDGSSLGDAEPQGSALALQLLMVKMKMALCPSQLCTNPGTRSLCVVMTSGFILGES